MKKQPESQRLSGDDVFKEDYDLAEFDSLLDDLHVDSSKYTSKKRTVAKKETLEKEMFYEKIPRREVIEKESDVVEGLPVIDETGKVVKVMKSKEKPSEQLKKPQEDPSSSSSEKEVEEEVESDAEIPSKSGEPEDQSPQLSPEEAYEKAVLSIASACELAFVSPQKACTRGKDQTESPLQQVNQYLKSTDQRIEILAMLSLMKTFNDILPNYRIMEDRSDEKGKLLKREIRFLHKFEDSLLQLYRSYLKHLSSVLRHAHDSNKRDVCLPAVHCVCELIRKHYTFNSSEALIKIVAPLLVSKDREYRNLVCDAVTEVFVSDTRGNSTFYIIHELGNQFRRMGYSNLHPDVSKIFLSLPLKEAMGEDDELGKKSKKRMKKDVIDSMIAESEGPDPRLYASFQKDTLQEVLITYFRMLKSNSVGEYIHIVLEGLSHVHSLLNSRIMIDVLKLLRRIMEQMPTLTVEQCLKCIRSALEFINSLSAISIALDESIFVNKLYSIMNDMISEKYTDLLPLLFKCIDLAFLSRKELVHERVAAFIKSLCTISLHIPAKHAAAALSLSRSLLKHYPSNLPLVDNEDGRRVSGLYSFSASTPEFSQAHNATLFEICALKKYYHTTVSAHAQALGSNAPMRADESYSKIEKSDMLHKMFDVEK